MPTARKRIVKHARDSGNYWSSQNYTHEQLRQLCLQFNPVTIKTAHIGGDQESGFEQAFSSLAYAHLKDRAPRLLDFIVGFQLVDRNEDNTKAIGVFGFKLGKQWLYAPVFFLNGDLKGHELLYIKNQDMFVPMKENWVNYIMGRKPHILGEGSPKDVFQLGGLSPNIERLAWPPTRSKYGEAIASGLPGLDPLMGMAAASAANNVNTPTMPAAAPPAAPSPALAPTPVAQTPTAPAAGIKMGLAVDHWALGFMVPAAACMNKSANFLWRDLNLPPGKRFDLTKIAKAPFTAALANSPTLEQFLSEHWQLAKYAWDIAKRYPLIKRGFERFYGADFFKRVAEHCKAAAEAEVDNIMPRVRPQRRVKMAADSILPELPIEKKAVGDEKVKIVVKNDVPITANLSEPDKEKILAHGYLVKDVRSGEEVTKVYNTQVRTEMTNPHETGLYEILEAPGDFGRMLVISNPISNSGGENFCTVVRLGEGDKSWLNAHRTSLFSRKVEMDEAFRKWYDGLDSSKALQDGATYVAIGGRGEGTVPFTVREKYKKGDYESYRVDFHSYQDHSRGRKANAMPRTVYDNPKPFDADTDYITPYNALLVCNQRKDSKLTAISGELHVPEDTFKFLKIKDPPKPKKDKYDLMAPSSCCGDCSSDDPKPIMPGNISDIQLLFTEKTARVKLFGDHHEVHISSEKTGSVRLPYTQALFHLIRVHGTSEPAAQAMLKDAQAKANNRMPVLYRFKYADNYPSPGPGPSSPPFPAPQYGSEPMGYNNVSAIYPQEEQIPIPGMDSNRTDPRIYDPFLLPDPRAMNTAQSAAQTGQKEVFDTAMISGMLKAVRQDSLVDRYLGDLMKALDKLGRLLMSFFWHNEEFADRYGKSEMPELEDTLRNTFESLGDTVLFLREKEVEPAVDDVQDPTIEETARN